MAERQAKVEELTRRLAALEGQQQLQRPGGEVAVVQHAPGGAVRLKEVIPTLPRFDGEDRARPIRSWLNNIESHGVAYGWNLVQTMLAAKQCLDESAKVWALRQDTQTWQKFREELEEEYGDAASAADVMFEMQKRRRKQGESASIYIQVMRNLGAQCDV